LAREVFVDRAAAAGLRFEHSNGMTGEYYLPEILSGGGALLDYDRDGDLDVLLIQGHELGSGETSARPNLRLWRNDLVPGDESPAFEDVTEGRGLDTLGYGMGIATGDYDNDGWVDVYLTALGPNQLFRNNGDGSFSDVTTATGTHAAGWSTSATFFDFDRDGWLDLYVAQYVGFDPKSNKQCVSPVGRRDYCASTNFAGQSDKLFRNRGDGSFEDVSEAAGIETEASNGLGVVAEDFDADGWTDIYVANDMLPNILWRNNSDGSFRDEALMAGSAVNAQGRAEASMGIAAADFDADGDSDLFMTHLDEETNTLFENDGKGLFLDATNARQLAVPSLPLTGFGTVALDYDNDAWIDLFVVNGAVYKLDAQADAGDSFPFRQPKLLFRNTGSGSFEDVTARAGAVLAVPEVSRGACAGDIDNDGDTDVLILNNNGSARLLINQVGHKRNWLGLRLVGTPGQRDMLGARVAVDLASGATLWRRAASDGSYLSASDPRVLVGLGENAAVTLVRVFWPGGKAEQWEPPALGCYTTLVQGKGTPWVPTSP
jgi:hypothetical protein